MNINIVFGTIKKAGRDLTSNEKYAGKAVVTVEGIKGEGKSRRVLFNSTAMELLKIPAGAQQNLIFGFVEADELVNRKLLIANADLLPGKEDTVVYNVSKNKVSYEETKEKGKAIASSALHKEINSFLEVDENISHEYSLVFFGESAGLDLYEFVKLNLEEDGKSINDLVQNPLSYTGYQQADLMEASLDNDFVINNDDDFADPNEVKTEEAIKVADELEETIEETTEEVSSWENNFSAE
jgi:hypothetical protein